MATSVVEPVRTPDCASAASTSVTLPSGGSFPCAASVIRKANITKIRIDLANLTCAVTAGAGGTTSAIGQKLFTLPQGHYIILASKIILDITTQAGLSAATTVVSLGTATATSASNGALTSTEADILVSTTGPASGTLAAETSKAVDVVGFGTGSAVGQLDATAATKDVYLNIGATWTHATETAVTFTIGTSSYVELTVIDLGDI